MPHFHSVSSANEPDSERQTIAASQAAKPLPPLPRGWSRICHETGLLLRGMGLGIIVTSFQGFFTKNFPEPEKVAIRRSRITAILRIMIHVVPIGVAIFEIVLNLKGHFVGEHFDKQNYIQFGAKAHEIAMQASIATILLSYIRYQISVGKGMPFGAVLSGLHFLQVNYLWSVELWSSLLSKDFQLRKKTGFAVLILISIAVAATAGPSSASLLIARQGLWPIASTYLAVNASLLDIWPDRLDEKDIEPGCAKIRNDPFPSKPHCPILDLYELSNTFDTGVNAELPQGMIVNIRIQSQKYLSYNRFLSLSLCDAAIKDQICATVPQRQFINGFHTVQEDFYTNLTNGYQFLQKDYNQPYAVASCVTDIVKDAYDQSPLRFAHISETDSELKRDREIVSVPNLTKGEIVNNTSGDNSNFRVDWVDLPMDVFNTGIPGAVIVNYQNPNDSSYNITMCTLNAGWGSSTMLTSEQTIGATYSHMSNIPSSWSHRGTKVVEDAYGYLFSTVPNFANFSNSPYPQRRISVSKEWMRFLNPTIVQANNSTENYISRALAMQSGSTNPFQPTEIKVSQLLSVLLALALADSGQQYAWEEFGDLKNATSTCDTCSIFEIEYSLFGWSYSARGTTTRLAITVMLAYCTLVFGHILYSAIFGVSSTAWDSAAELVALAMNSSPTKVLQNTCAGIIGRQAFETSVRVLATNPGHLELVFGEVKDPDVQTLEMNEKYGKLMDEDDNEEEDEPEFKTLGTLRKRAVAQSWE